MSEHYGLVCPASWEPGKKTLKPGLDLVGKIYIRDLQSIGDNVMAKVPKKIHEVFWEVNPDEVDTDKNPEYVIERILEYGTLAGVKWLRKTLGDDKIKSFVKKYGHRSLSSRTLNFWQVIYKFNKEECTPISSVRDKYSFWKY